MRSSGHLCRRPHAGAPRGRHPLTPADVRIPAAITILAVIALVSTNCSIYTAPEARRASLGESRRADRIEHGLLPTVAVRGRDTTWLLGDRMRRYGVPGVSLAVIDKGNVEWARAYGTLEGGGDRVKTTTLFQAGSISKAITAVAALRLVDRGVLRLDDDVNQKLESWKAPASDLTRNQPVTLRRLLSHGAGFNVPSFPGYVAGTPVPTLLQVLEGTAPANTPAVRVETPPGEWRYSGGGMTVVQQLIVDATGRPFAEVLRKEVFGRTEMTRTVAEQPLSEALAGTAAVGHASGRPVEGRWHVYPELAAAGLWSTAPDLAAFGVGVLRSIRGGHGGVVDRQTGHELATRQTGDWGLGFALSGSGDSLTVGHDGSTVGYVARVIVLPATGQGLAVMTNGESAALIDEIQRAVAKEYKWPVKPRVEKVMAAVDPALLPPLAGQYRLEFDNRTFDFRVEVVGARLMLTGPSGRPGEVLPLSENRFFSQETGNEFTFTREGKAVTSMVIDQQGQRFTARRL